MSRSIVIAIALATLVIATPNAWAQKPVVKPKPKTGGTSLVPQYTFAETLREQEEQLKSNPWLLRMAKSRAAQADDPHRPIYHYVNPEGRLNDPNGLCFWQGRWHLFYQAYPPSVVEVFANGKQCVALRVYPGREDSVGVSLRAQGRDAQLRSLDAWQMKNIYDRTLSTPK